MRECVTDGEGGTGCLGCSGFAFAGHRIRTRPGVCGKVRALHWAGWGVRQQGQRQLKTPLEIQVTVTLRNSRPCAASTTGHSSLNACEEHRKPARLRGVNLRRGAYDFFASVWDSTSGEGEGMGWFDAVGHCHVGPSVDESAA